MCDSWYELVRGARLPNIVTILLWLKRDNHLYWWNLVDTGIQIHNPPRKPVDPVILDYFPLCFDTPGIYDATPLTVAWILYGHVLCYLGLQKQIHTSPGAKFELLLMKELCKAWALAILKTTLPQNMQGPWRRKQPKKKRYTPPFCATPKQYSRACTSTPDSSKLPESRDTTSSCAMRSRAGRHWHSPNQIFRWDRGPRGISHVPDFVIGIGPPTSSPPWRMLLSQL